MLNRFKLLENPKDSALVLSLLHQPGTHQKVGSNSQRSSPRNTLHSDILQRNKQVPKCEQPWYDTGKVQSLHQHWQKHTRTGAWGWRGPEGSATKAARQGTGTRSNSLLGKGCFPLQLSEEALTYSGLASLQLRGISTMPVLAYLLSTHLTNHTSDSTAHPCFPSCSLPGHS